jgi:hypothetical protein
MDRDGRQDPIRAHELLAAVFDPMIVRHVNQAGLSVIGLLCRLSLPTAD